MMAQIIPLAEGTFTVDRSKKFIPFDPQHDRLQDRPKGSLLIEIQPFLVIAGSHYILLDTGLNLSNNQEFLLYQILKEKGIDPSQITHVLLSHLHKDHAGGICSLHPDGSYRLNFPQAIYYVHEDELKYALSHAQQNEGETGGDIASSYAAEEFELLFQSDQVMLLHDEGYIDTHIRYQLSGGHCPYHVVFWIQDQDEIIFYGGDVAPQYLQMKTRYVAKYDYDGRKSMELRQQFAEQGKREGWTFLFYHDVQRPVMKLI
ncbi:MBL fold metallo-hydrolase [Thermoflavifilum thermophilum]|nr:MBL fold metallo-hydrolase [Thermoflavifilum thermophilum]